MNKVNNTYINGSFQKSDSISYLDLINPSDEEIYGVLECTSVDDLENSQNGDKRQDPIFDPQRLSGIIEWRMPQPEPLAYTIGVGDVLTLNMQLKESLGDVLNGLVAAPSASAGVDQMAVEVSSKARSVGRKLQTGIAQGDGASPNLNSWHTLCDASQYTTASAGQALSFELLDELLDLVKAKDGEVDYLIMPSRTIRSYRTLVRALGGVNETIAFDMGNGRSRNVDVYNGIPVFQNDYLSVTETANGAALTTGALTSIYAGCFDDGSGRIGASMIHPNGVPMGLDVTSVGEAEAKDQSIMRVKSYSNFVNYNRRGLARLPSINN